MKLKRWQKKVNKQVDIKLDTINRHFGDLRDKIEPMKHKITEAGKFCFRDYVDFKENPAKFFDLDVEVDAALARTIQ